MTEFAARPPIHKDNFVGEPRHDIQTSRWVKTATTFGPLGRLVVTGLLVLMLIGGLQMTGLFSAFALWFFLGWSVLAGFVMRDTWRPVRIEGLPTGRIGTARRHLADRLPRLGRSHSWKTLLAPFAVLGAGLMLYGWTTGDSVARYGIFLGFGVAATVALLLRMTNN